MERRALAMVVVPARRSTLMAVLRRVAIARGALRVRVWLASSAKVTSRMCVVQGFDGPVSAQPIGQFGWGGLVSGEVGDGVDGDGRPSAGGQVHPTSTDADGLDGVREVQADCHGQR